MPIEELREEEKDDLEVDTEEGLEDREDENEVEEDEEAFTQM